MKLHKEVAHDVGLMVKQIVLNPAYEKDIYVHTVAEKIVRATLLADTVAWYRYMTEEIY